MYKIPEDMREEILNKGILYKVKRKHTNFKNAYEALVAAIKKEEKLKNFPCDKENLFNLFSVSIIRYFEIAYETAWKFLKEYLMVVYSIEVASPKAIFRVCYEYKILSNEVTDELIELADTRNLTTHVYDQAVAREVFDSIKKHEEVLAQILKITF